MKNTTKAAGIAGIVMGALGVAAAVAGSIAKGKDDTVVNANNEFDAELSNFCENNKNEETYTNTPDENQEPEAPAEEG